MIMAKERDAVETRAADSDSSMDGSMGTSEDAKDMYRLGRSQQLKVWCMSKSEAIVPQCSRLVKQRNFHSISILGLTCVIMCTWMGILS